jgi:hypothetical protein
MNYSPIHSDKPIEKFNDSNLNVTDIEKGVNQNDQSINIENKNKFIKKLEEIFYMSIVIYVLIFGYLIIGIINLCLSSNLNDCYKKEIHYPTILYCL